MPQSTKNFDFPWGLLKVVLDGLSILDLPKLEVKSMAEATEFIRAYGYNPNDEDDHEMIWHHFEDAIAFLSQSLPTPQASPIPEHLQSRDSVQDIRRLLLMASGNLHESDQRWACAILRMMHVLIHIYHDPKLKYFSEVQKHVLGRLDEHLYVDENDGSTYLGSPGDSETIKLLYFKKKERKNREREIIKLLHKPESVVEEIFDRIGFRMVTETKVDCLRVLKFLLKNNVFSIANIRPGRSRNWLLDLGRFEEDVKKLKASSKLDLSVKENQEKLLLRLERKIRRPSKSHLYINPFSSKSYRAIQFTCREMVKVRNPTFRAYRQMKEQLEKIPGGNQILNEVYPHPEVQYKYIFFPFEIQIMDVKSYADSIFGKSNHQDYRKKQVEAASRRIFGTVN